MGPPLANLNRQDDSVKSGSSTVKTTQSKYDFKAKNRFGKKLYTKHFSKNPQDESFNIQFKKNFKLIMSGASGCGKSFLLKKILENASEMMEFVPKSIIYFYQMHQELYDRMSESVEIPMEFIQGMPEEETIEDILKYSAKPCLIVFDDFNQVLNKIMANLFQVGSHHGNLCLALLIQNLFTKSPFMRDISLRFVATHLKLTFYKITIYYIFSASDIILMKSPRDQTVKK